VQFEPAILLIIVCTNQGNKGQFIPKGKFKKKKLKKNFMAFFLTKA